MSRITRRPQARRDLVEQWVWYSETAGTEIADRFLESVEATLSFLANHPMAGASVTIRRSTAPLRRFRVTPGFEKILLFYVPTHEGIELVRAVYGSRDLESLLANQRD